MEFKDKVVAFVDILGFKNLIENCESGDGRSLDDVLALLDELGRKKSVESLRKRGSSLCPLSPCSAKDLDFVVTQLSDCAIVSAEASPLGVLNVASHCNSAVLSLMRHGLMCRGYITIGKVHHTSDQIIGTGYQKAYAMESQVSAFKIEVEERGTPFVEVDSIVVELIESLGDDCVKEIFSRIVKSDGDVLALYPFHVLGHSFLIDERYSPEEELAQVQHIRDSINWFKDRIRESVDVENESANRKVEHYVRALDGQLENCTKVEKTIEMLSMPLGKLNPGLFKN